MLKYWKVVLFLLLIFPVSSFQPDFFAGFGTAVLLTLALLQLVRTKLGHLGLGEAFHSRKHFWFKVGLGASFAILVALAGLYRIFAEGIVGITYGVWLVLFAAIFIGLVILAWAVQGFLTKGD